MLFDERDVAQLVSKVLVDSKVLVNNNKAIGAQTKEAMGKLAGVTAAIYRGSKYAQTSGVHMMKASKNSGPFASSDFKHSKCQVGQHLLATSKKGKESGFFFVKLRWRLEILLFTQRVINLITLIVIRY